MAGPYGEVRYGFNPKTFKMLCVHAGYTIETLADFSGVPYNTIQQWNSGRRTPTSAKLQLVADVLECSLDDFDWEIEEDFQASVIEEIKAMLFRHLRMEDDIRAQRLALEIADRFVPDFTVGTQKNQPSLKDHLKNVGDVLGFDVKQRNQPLDEGEDDA